MNAYEKRDTANKLDFKEPSYQPKPGQILYKMFTFPARQQTFSNVFRIEP